MFITIFIAFISLIILVSLHELGHFLTAKFFGVKVEEFGLGYPPRIFGKKIGGTIYSLNLLPFGAFVRLPDEGGEPTSKPSAFLGKPLWQRFLIIFNGALAFWVVAIVLFSFVFVLGASTAIEDWQEGFQDTKVQISGVAPKSPAETAGIKVGDSVTKAQSVKRKTQNIDKVKELQDFISDNKGEEIILTIQRGQKVFEIAVVPRVAPPQGEGALGIGLVRTGLKSYPWYEAPFRGIEAALRMTKMTVVVYYQAVVKILQNQKVPSGLQMVGPIGIVGILSQGVAMGISYFLQMIGALAINVAVINLLPIPAFDGGKLLFLGIEALRKKPVSRKVEEKITTVFFVLLIALMVFVTFKDIRRLF